MGETGNFRGEHNAIEHVERQKTLESIFLLNERQSRAIAELDAALYSHDDVAADRIVNELTRLFDEFRVVALEAGGVGADEWQGYWTKRAR